MKPPSWSQGEVAKKQGLGLHKQHIHLSDPIKSITVLRNPPDLTISNTPCSQLPELPEIPQVHEAHCCPGSHQDPLQPLRTPYCSPHSCGLIQQKPSRCPAGQSWSRAGALCLPLWRAGAALFLGLGRDFHFSTIIPSVALDFPGCLNASPWLWAGCNQL